MIFGTFSFDNTNNKVMFTHKPQQTILILNQFKDYKSLSFLLFDFKNILSENKRGV